MNYPIPFSQGNTAYFYANSLNNVGSFNKPMNDRVLITVDYTKLIPPVWLIKSGSRLNPVVFRRSL